VSQRKGDAGKVSVDRDEYEFLQALAETVDDFLNAPFPRLREDALGWLTDTLGDDIRDDEPKARQARLDEMDCDECRDFLVRAIAWKQRRRRVEPAPILTLHRHSDREH
jgi:hypothetical protein